METNKYEFSGLVWPEGRESATIAELDWEEYRSDLRDNQEVAAAGLPSAWGGMRGRARYPHCIEVLPSIEGDCFDDARKYFQSLRPGRRVDVSGRRLDIIAGDLVESDN